MAKHKGHGFPKDAGGMQPGAGQTFGSGLEKGGKHKKKHRRGRKRD